MYSIGKKKPAESESWSGGERRHSSDSEREAYRRGMEAARKNGGNGGFSLTVKIIFILAAVLNGFVVWEFTQLRDEVRAGFKDYRDFKTDSLAVRARYTDKVDTLERTTQKILENRSDIDELKSQVGQLSGRPQPASNGKRSRPSRSSSTQSSAPSVSKVLGSTTVCHVGPVEGKPGELAYWPLTLPPAQAWDHIRHGDKWGPCPDE